MTQQLKHPFTCIISGPTGCGKTIFAIALVENSHMLISPPPEDIVWCYGEYQDSYNKIAKSGVKLHDGLPDLDQFDGRRRTLILLDDLMHETDERVAKIFTKQSHHRNISAIYITQNLFHSNRHNRTLNLNAHYIVLFKNPRDAAQISHLARQMYPNKSKFLIEAFRDSTDRPHGYLFLDLKSDTDEQLRVRTNVLLHDREPEVGLLPYAYVHK